MPPRPRPTHLRDTAGDPALIAEYRRRRAAFDDIARSLGITRTQAIAAYRERLAEAETLERSEHLAEQVALADDAIRDLQSIARQHEKSSRTSVEAWNAIRGWAEHQARLTGLFDEQKPAATPGKLHAIRQAHRP